MTKSFSRIAFALLAGAAVAAPAAAQEAKNFNGPFVGVQLGWQQDRQSLTTSTVPPTTTRSSGDGFAYGGQAGYDVQLGSSAVLGVEASITGRTGSNRFPTFDLEAGRTINATARAGWLITPEGLLYARGGYSNARFNIQGPAGASETRDGYLVGAGYEHMLARIVSARVEYNYSDYGNDTLPGIGGGARLNYHRHAVMTGVNFRF
jgi:outer membrane immunogenic protein